MRLVDFATSDSLIAKSTAVHYNHCGLHVPCYLYSYKLLLDNNFLRKLGCTSMSHHLITVLF
jgi:hypothetical protein